MLFIDKRYLNFVFVLIFIILGFFYCTNKSYAATINLTPNAGSYNVGDTIRVKVTINTLGMPVNATENTINFSTNTLSLVSISKAGSIITNWIVDPTFSNTTGTASLVGGILGGNGYNGTSGLVATLVFKVKSTGIANVSFLSSSILANDGNGTDIVSGKGSASFSISEAVIPKIIKVPVTENNTINNINDSTIKIQQIKDNTNIKTSPRFLITSPRPAKNNEYTIQIDSLDIISWVNDGNNIFQLPPVSKGDHNINVQAFDNSGNNMSGFIKFYNNIIITPVITNYPQDLNPGDLIVLKGLAEPDSDVELSILNTDTEQLTVAHTRANSAGKFSYVSDMKVTLGIYSVTAKTITESGAESMESLPINFSVVMNLWNKIVSIFSSKAMISWLLLLCLFVSMYIVYKTHKSHKKLRKRIEETKDTIVKSFGILEEDISGSDHASMSEIKKDLRDAEKLLIKEVKDIDKEI